MNIKIQKILQYVLLGGIFIIPFIPLFVPSSMFFPFITGKNFAFRIIVELLVGVLAVLAYWDASYRPKWSWVLASFVVFVGVVALADVFGENPYKSIWSNYERMGGLVGLVHLFAYFWVIISVLKTEKIWMRLLNIILGVSVIMGIYGLLQLFGFLKITQGSVRVDTTFGNAAYLAVYNLFNIFIAAFMLFKQKREIWLRVVYGLVIILNIVILYLTETRGAILGLFAGVILSTILIALFERKNLVVKKTAIGILLGVLFLIGGFFAIKDTSFVKDSSTLNRFATISLNETTTKSRFMIWDMAWQGFKEHPVLGWGQGNFNFVFSKYYNPGMYGQEPWFDRAHDIIFDWLIVGGIFGLLAYLSLFGASMFLLWFSVDSLSLISKSILTGLFAGYFFQNLFVFDNLISYTLFFTMLGYIHSISTREGKLKLLLNKIFSRVKNIFSGKMMDMVVAPLVVVVVIFSIYFVNYKAMAANFTIIDAFKPHPQEKGLLTNLSLFKKAIAYDSFGTQEAREQLARMTFSVSGFKVSNTIKEAFLTTTNSELQKQIKEVPNDAKNYLLYASFLTRYGRYDDAIIQYDKALKLSPKKQAIYFGLVDSYLNKKEIKKALSFAKKAFELETKYKDARKIYAAVAIYNKDYVLVKKLLVPVFGTVIPDDSRILQAYSAVGQYSKVISMISARIKKDPTNLKTRISLVLIYLKDGKRRNAIKEIEKMIKLSPKFKKQGQYYIKSIRAGENPEGV